MMHKYKYRTLPAAQKARVYAEGKQGFKEGKHRGDNPYTANNLALGVTWWNGWDTGEEESQVSQPDKRKPTHPVLISD